MDDKANIFEAQTGMRVAIMPNKIIAVGESETPGYVLVFMDGNHVLKIRSTIENIEKMIKESK